MGEPNGQRQNFTNGTPPQFAKCIDIGNKARWLIFMLRLSFKHLLNPLIWSDYIKGVQGCAYVKVYLPQRKMKA